MGGKVPQAEICMGNPDGVMVTVHSKPSPYTNFLITVIIHFQNSECKHSSENLACKVSSSYNWHLLAVELEQHLLLLAVELCQVKTVSNYVTGFFTVQTGGSKFPRLRVEIGEKLMKKFVVVTIQMIKDPGGRKSEGRIFQERGRRRQVWIRPVAVSFIY